MFAICILFLIALRISVDSVIAFNSCQLEVSCDQSSVHCSNQTHLCLCLSTARFSRNGVCVHVSSVNSRCLLYQPCLDAHCLLTNGLELGFEVRKEEPIWKSLNESLVISNQRLLAFCRCDKSRAHLLCNYKVIGKLCTHNINCSAVPHSQCIGGLCACNQSYYHSDDNCLRKKNFDELCIESVECISNLYCRSSQCRCRKNYDFDVKSGVCVYKSVNENHDTTASKVTANIWDGIAKVGGFIIIIVLMLFLLH